MKKWIWKTLTVAYESTAKDFVYYENRSGEEYKRRKYKAYYVKNGEECYIIYYAERRKDA